MRHAIRAAAAATITAALACGRGASPGVVGGTDDTPPKATTPPSGAPTVPSPAPPPPTVDPAGARPCGGGWCWANFPLGVDVATAWGSAPEDLWVAAGLGTMLHWDGSGWSASWLGFRSFHGMWGTSATDAWALDGAGAMLHWGGTSWSERGERAPCGTARWNGFSAAGGVAWCELAGPSIARFDGTRWETIALPPAIDGMAPAAIEAIWAAGRDDVFVSVTAGDASPWPPPMVAVLRYVAGQWTEYPVPGIAALTGSGPDDVWAMAAHSLSQWHFDGARWTETDLGGPVFVAAPGDLWGVGFHWVDGVPVRSDSAPEQFLWSFGRDDVWASRVFDPPTTLVHWDGVRWAPTADLAGEAVTDLPAHDALTPAGIPQPPGGSYASWVPRSDLAFAIGARSIDGANLQDVVWRWDGREWTEALAGATWQRHLGTFSSDDRGSMWSARPDDAWASHAAAYHWDGAAWTQVSGGPVYAPCIWGTGPDDVWASVAAQPDATPYTWRPQPAWHWDGRAWALLEEPVLLACGKGSTAAAGRGTVWTRDPAWP
jgi:hypothetical protein